MSKNIVLAVLVAACGASDSAPETAVVAGVHDAAAGDLDDLVQAATDLQAAAPADHGWDARDAPSITAMREAWKRARIAYAHVEAATAPNFPEANHAMNARYDDYLAALGPAGDADAFDRTGATGMHSIERILYADVISPQAVAFESTLPGYRPARWPANEREAIEFKLGLCQQLIDDASQLRDQWSTAAIDVGAVFHALIGLMNEQREAVNLAAAGDQDSRYAQLTLFDLRNHLDGTKQIYAPFRAWIVSANSDAGRDIELGFQKLDAVYRAQPGDALPAVPDTWSSDRPSAADLQTPFGKLWRGVHACVDPQAPGSIVVEMNDVAVVLGFPEFL